MPYPSSEEAIDYIESVLSISRRVVLSFLAVGINSDLEEDRVKRKLLNLYQVIKGLSDKGCQKELIINVIRDHSYRGLEARMESVISLIQQEKYDHQILLDIALRAAGKLQS